MVSGPSELVSASPVVIRVCVCVRFLSSLISSILLLVCHHTQEQTLHDT